MTVPPSARKVVNEVKFLAFRQLMADGESQLEVRARLGMCQRTYYRYLRAYRELIRSAAVR